ncbi:MAG: PIN domain-containing protein [Candidatus Promineifilaceae bacterium]|jgi:predicted nucleic acid-binding protein
MSDSHELLFDTNCLIDIYLGRKRIRPTFEAILAGELLPFMSVITEAELWRGLRAGELEIHQALVSHFTILPLRSNAARLAGNWMQQFQSNGLGWMDALITATANVNGLTVLTRDKRLALLLAEDADFIIYE